LFLLGDFNGRTGREINGKIVKRKKGILSEMAELKIRKRRTKLHQERKRRSEES
jgi:hypothetical protein